MKQIILILFTLSLFSFNNRDVASSHSLFKIERSKDANQIFYNLNTINNNKLNPENPINIYWIRKTEGGKIKPLTWIQKHYAYGVDYTYASENFAKFHFVSSNKRDFILKRDKTGDFKVFTQLNNKEVEVNRIFIQIDGGTFWFPNISHVELHTKDPLTHKNIVEIIVP